MEITYILGDDFSSMKFLNLTDTNIPIKYLKDEIIKSLLNSGTDLRNTPINLYNAGNHLVDEEAILSNNIFKNEYPLIIQYEMKNNEEVLVGVDQCHPLINYNLQGNFFKKINFFCRLVLLEISFWKYFNFLDFSCVR